MDIKSLESILNRLTGSSSPLNMMFLLVISAIVHLISGTDYECEFYLAQSTLFHAGRGVFAGTDLPPATLIEESPNLLVRDSVVHSWYLNDYIYMSHVANHSEAPLGMAMIYNHHNDQHRNVEHFSSPYPAKDITRARTIHSNFAYKTMSKPIRAGDELFTSYGSDDWFTGRGYELLTPEVAPPSSDDSNSDNNDDDNTKPSLHSRALDDLRRDGVCLSHTYVNTSRIRLAGRGLFTKRSFQRGDLITVSPVTFLFMVLCWQGDRRPLPPDDYEATMEEMATVYIKI